MLSSILNRLFVGGGGGGGRIWRSKRLGYGSELVSRKVTCTMSKAGASAPWLMLEPERESSGDIVFNFYSLAEKIKLSFVGGFPYDAKTMRFVGSSHGWLALFNYHTKDLFLTNPVSGRRINLPPTDDIVSKVVLSCSPDDDEDECRAVMTFVPKAVDIEHLVEAILAETLAARTLAPYLPAMSLGPAQSKALCRLNGNGAWTPISTDDRVTSCGDFVYSRKKGFLFCLTTNYSPEIEKLGFDATRRPNLSDVEVWDVSNPECPRIERTHSLNELPRLVRDSSGMSERRYLVYSEQSDQLYLVRRHMMERVDDAGEFVDHIYLHNRRGWDNSYPYKTVGFDVHMIDIDNHGNLLMDEKVSLDNVAIFIGINHGLVMEAADQFKLNSNSIYFTDDTIHTPPNEHDVDGNEWCWVADKSIWAESCSVYGGHDIGIFDCENKTISPCFYPTDPPSLKRIDPPPLWFTPQDPTLLTLNHNISVSFHV